MPDINDLDPKQLEILKEQMKNREYEGLTKEEIEKLEEKKHIQKENNIKLIHETLDVLDAGFYKKDDKNIYLPYSKSELKNSNVFLESNLDLSKLDKSKCKCHFTCENKDALALTYEKQKDKKDEKILVLNLASNSRPGGGVLDGSSGQEEDLCRKTTLYASLNSDSSKPYYDYNNAQNTHLGTDAMILSQNVTVIRDEKENFLSDPFNISVLSASAPMIRLGLEGKTQSEYEKLLSRRLKKILDIAIKYDFQHLILGAFGCGAFGNDARLVSNTFKTIFNNGYENYFNEVNFAVLCKDKDYNYKEFYRNFGV